MKAVILAGGFGTRLSEETTMKPKPMVEIGGRPILWHIMKTYSAHGINDFIICCGYKGYLIKEYFSNYYLHMSDVVFNLNGSNMEILNNKAEPWKVTLVNTGENTMTGGRLGRVKNLLKNENAFCFTYGDGLTDANISEIIKFHNDHGKEATLLASRPAGRYGILKFGTENIIKSFQEKPEGEGSWINGGYFVLSPKVFDRISGDSSIWEEEPLSGLANDNQLVGFKHEGFWQSMDTLREKILLNDLWDQGNPPWRVW